MRRTVRVGLSAVLVLTVFGAARAQDLIRYHDRAARKEVKVTAKIEEESTAGLKVQLTEGGKRVSKTIPVGDIIEVRYHAPEVGVLAFGIPFAKEDNGRREKNPKKRAALLHEARTGYQKLEDQMRGRPNVRRYLQFKAALVTAELARDDPAQAVEAVKLLGAFTRDHPGSWQSLPALKALAQLHEAAGSPDDARKAYEAIAELPDVPREIRQESEVLVGRLLLRGRKYADAEKRLAKLASRLTAADAQRPYVLAYLTQSRMAQNNLDGADKTLREVLRASADARLRGTAYNLLGDYHRARGQDEEAFWHYLRVDAQYNDDAEEHAKALYYLATLFDKVRKDPQRGKDCLRRLREPRFAGSAYQRLAGKGD